ncbi:MAG: hypothetical protein ABSG03_37020 [Bryobacteraceae bacterium]
MILDFNKAEIPACSFTAYALCHRRKTGSLSASPPGNRSTRDLRITRREMCSAPRSVD